MKPFFPRIAVWLLLFYLIPTSLSAQDKPVALHQQNPHYFLFHDRPAILITSGEHYGAVMNLDFDYKTYLKTLHSRNLNLTRLFSGAYVEPDDAFNIAHNTLAPLPGRYICPWARSTTPGYANGGNKFDLTRWDDRYFSRLKDFMSAAEKRHIVVELALFCPFYGDGQWKLSPMNAINNINGTGKVVRTDVYTLDRNGGLLKVQEALVRKIVAELKGYDNLIYEICNEPYFGGVTDAWQRHIAAVIQDAEKTFPARHLISRNIANGSKKITRPDPAISVFNFHYASPPVTVALNYHLDKVIGDNETGFRGNSDSTYRREGWQFILAGGGLFNNLDYSFAAGHEKGTYRYPSTQPGGGSVSLRNQLSYLKKFMYRFDFVRMRPDSTTITGGLPAKASAQVLSEPGQQYAVYISGGGPLRLELNLPSGDYSAQWMDPLTGKYEKKKRLHSEGRVTLASPAYPQDLALRLVKTD